MTMEWKLEVVLLPVADVDRSKWFYNEQVGFNVDLDQEIGGGMRIVQLTPHGSGCSVTLTNQRPDEAATRAPRLQLVVTDIDAARARLVEGGVDVSPVQHFGESGIMEGKGGPWNSFVFFSDPDGNDWAVQERPAPDA